MKTVKMPRQNSKRNKCIINNLFTFFYLQKIDAVVVGADRIAKNGDTANKIGTFQIALAAQYHKIPFYIGK